MNQIEEKLSQIRDVNKIPNKDASLRPVTTGNDSEKNGIRKDLIWVCLQEALLMSLKYELISNKSNLGETRTQKRMRKEIRRRKYQHFKAYQLKFKDI